MPDTIKRNKFVAEYLKKQLIRLGMDTSLTLFYEYYLYDIGVKASMTTVNMMLKNPELTPDIFNEDEILIETLKCIGIMEVSKNQEEFKKLLEKKEKIKSSKKKEKTDFDKILGAMMKVPKPKDEK